MACDLGRFRIYLPNLHVNKEVHGQGSERGQPRSPSHRGGGWGGAPAPLGAPCSLLRGPGLRRSLRPAAGTEPRAPLRGEAHPALLPPAAGGRFPRVGRAGGAPQAGLRGPQLARFSPRREGERGCQSWGVGGNRAQLRAGRAAPEDEPRAPPRSPRLPPPDQRPHCGALLNRWWGRFLIGRSGSTRQAPGLWARRVIFPELFILLLKGGGRAAVQRCKLLNRRKREGRLAESCTCPAWLTGGDARGVGQPGPRGDVSGEIPSRTGRRPGRSSAWGRGSQPRTHPGGDL